MITVSILPLLLLYFRGVSNEFQFENIALSQLTLNDHKLILAPFDSSGIIQIHANGQSLRFVPTLILAILSAVTGLSLKTIQFLPICGVALIPLFYVFGKRILKSNLYAALLTVYLMYTICFVNVFHSVYIQAFALVLFFVFVFFSLRLLERFEVSSYVLLPVTFVAIFFTYYTTTLLTVIFVSFIAIFVLLPSMRSATKLRFIPLACALLVIFLMFDPASEGFLHLLRVHGVSYTTAALPGQDVSILPGQDVSAIPGQVSERAFSLGYPLPSGVPLILSIGFYLVPLILSIAYLWCFIRDFIKRETPSYFAHAFLFALLAVLVARQAIYLIWGGIIDLVYPALFLPFVAFYMLLRAKGWWSSKFSTVSSRNMTALLMVLLVALSMTHFFIKLDSLRGYRYATEEPALMWNVQHIKSDKSTFMTELATGEQLLVALAECNATKAHVDLFTNRNYVFSSDGTITYPVLPHTGERYDYLLISRWAINNYFMVGDWLIGKPIGKNLDKLNSEPGINKLYDGEIMIYSFSGN
jgi:hypothetical protein